MQCRIGRNGLVMGSFASFEVWGFKELLQVMSHMLKTLDIQGFLVYQLQIIMVRLEDSTPGQWIRSPLLYPPSYRRTLLYYPEES